MEQCWIYRLDRVLTLGNCCIKNYFPKGFRVKSCEICGATHRNRKDNICKRCRWARYAQLVAKQEAEEAKWVAAEEAKWGAARLAFAEAAERAAAEAAERAAAEEAKRAAAEEAKRAAEEAKRLPAKALRALMIAREQQDAFELDLALKRAGVRTSSGV
jgi:predicted  nucleic acid-binding Zn-ribbon protein